MGNHPNALCRPSVDDDIIPSNLPPGSTAIVTVPTSSSGDAPAVESTASLSQLDNGSPQIPPSAVSSDDLSTSAPSEKAVVPDLEPTDADNSSDEIVSASPPVPPEPSLSDPVASPTTTTTVRTAEFVLEEPNYPDYDGEEDEHSDDDAPLSSPVEIATLDLLEAEGEFNLDDIDTDDLDSDLDTDTDIETDGEEIVELGTDDFATDDYTDSDLMSPTTGGGSDFMSPITVSVSLGGGGDSDLSEKIAQVRAFYGPNSVKWMEEIGLGTLSIDLRAADLTQLSQIYSYDAEANDFAVALNLQGDIGSFRVRQELRETDGFIQQITNLAESFSDRFYGPSPYRFWEDEILFPSSIRNERYRDQTSYLTALTLLRSRMRPERAVETLMDLSVPILDPFSAQSGGRGRNFFLELYTYLILRTRCLLSSCAMCDCSIDRRNEDETCAAMPVICTKFTCMFRYIEFGICSSVAFAIYPSSLAVDLKQNPNLSDLLISMAYSAAKSARANIIFDPKPELSTDQFCRLLDRCPPVDELVASSEGNEELLRELLGRDLYSLLWWLCSKQRPAMLKLPEKRRIPEIDTENQFLMLVDDPVKQTEFKRNREEYGSYFAFHGSKIGCWHGILRKGLLVASGTKFQSTGAAYGRGIYMAVDSSTSFGYTSVGTTWPHSKFADVDQLKGIAICEVVKAPGVPTVASPFYVVDAAEHVCVRFLLFPEKGNFTARAEDLNLHRYVK